MNAHKLEIIKNRLIFLSDAPSYQRLDTEEKEIMGLVIASVVNCFNANIEVRNKELHSVLNLFEELSSNDINFQNYVVTEFFENLHFPIEDFKENVILKNLYEKYII